MHCMYFGKTLNIHCYRRLIGVVFGSKGTDAILSVEYYCCDRPNPILQVFTESFLGLRSAIAKAEWFLTKQCTNLKA